MFTNSPPESECTRNTGNPAAFNAVTISVTAASTSSPFLLAKGTTYGTSVSSTFSILSPHRTSCCSLACLANPASASDGSSRANSESGRSLGGPKGSTPTSSHPSTSGSQSNSSSSRSPAPPTEAGLSPAPAARSGWLPASAASACEAASPAPCSSPSSSFEPCSCCSEAGAVPSGTGGESPAGISLNSLVGTVYTPTKAYLTFGKYSDFPSQVGPTRSKFKTNDCGVATLR